MATEAEVNRAARRAHQALLTAGLGSQTNVLWEARKEHDHQLVRWHTGQGPILWLMANDALDYYYWETRERDRQSPGLPTLEAAVVWLIMMNGGQDSDRNNTPKS